jgi:phage anti-repressor protein
MNLINNDNNLFISAIDLHKELGMKRQFSKWIIESIERAGLERDKDFMAKMTESSGGRRGVDYLLTRDSSLSIIIMSGGQFAKDLRKKVIELYNQHDTGLAFTTQQIESLIELSKAMTLISIQEDVERKHFALYNNKYEWVRYRAALLGYGTNDLMKAMQEVNKKHYSIRKSLIKLDANELIRTGIIDLFIILGKTKEYAINVGNLCKTFAKEMKLGNIIWDDTIENPLQLNEPEIIERKKIYNNQLKLKQ